MVVLFLSSSALTAGRWLLFQIQKHVCKILRNLLKVLNEMQQMSQI